MHADLLATLNCRWLFSALLCAALLLGSRPACGEVLQLYAADDTRSSAVVLRLTSGLAILTGFYGRYVSLALVPLLLGALVIHAPNGWVFNAPNGGWEYPAFLALTALQLFSYEVADYLGKDVDQPRNLAKSVTVE